MQIQQAHKQNHQNLTTIVAVLSLLLFACAEEQKQIPHTQQNQSKTTQANPSPEPLTIDTTSTVDSCTVTHVATMQTTKGAITIALFGEDAPKTVLNFVELAKTKLYDGVLFHRVVKGFVLQGGDPNTKDESKKSIWGTGGATYNNKPLIDEISDTSKAMKRGYKRGIIAMANKGTINSASSQFFICLDKAETLPPTYTIFGKVIDGWKTIEAIENGESDPNDGREETPLHPERIIKLTIDTKQTEK